VVDRHFFLLDDRLPFSAAALELLVPKTIPAPREIFLEIGKIHTDRGRVDVGMEIDPPGPLQVFIDDHFDLFLTVVDQSERRNGSGFQAEIVQEPLFGSEAQPILADLSAEGFEIGLLRGFDDDQIVTVPLLVSQEKILAVGTGDIFPVLFSLLNRVDWRMFMPGESYPQLLQDFVDLFFFVRCHLSSLKPE
jgi:hypothetical protein